MNSILWYFVYIDNISKIVTNLAKIEEVEKEIARTKINHNKSGLQ